MKTFSRKKILLTERGFSLLEVIVGLTILLILLVSASNGFLRLTLLNRSLQARSDAAIVGRKVIDELRLLNINALPAAGPIAAPAPEVIDGRSFDVSITSCPASAGAALCVGNQRVIQVDVSDPNNGNRLLYSTQTIFTAL